MYRKNGNEVQIPKRTYVDVIRKGGKRKGYITLVCGAEGKLEVGYSLCEQKDRFKGDLGLGIALKRGRRWVDRDRVLIRIPQTKTYLASLGCSGNVLVPHTLAGRILKDVDRVTRKHSDATIPMWVSSLQHVVEREHTQLGRKGVI